MSWLTLLGIAVALAMDAFAVAIVAGAALDPLTRRHIFRLAFHFGLFQALMPVIGWLAGIALYHTVAAFDHWVAFGLLGFVGGKMIWGALRGDRGTRQYNDPTSGMDLIVLSVATSIDALAVGLSLAMVGESIVVPVITIGVVAAGFTTAGMVLGRRIGALWGKRVEVLGGVFLIAIGANILYTHLTNAR